MGSLIAQTCASGTPPTQTGGTVVDGTYVVTSSQNYNCGDAGDAGSQVPTGVTFIISGGCFTIIFSENVDGGVETANTSGTIAFSDNIITTTAQCPTVGAASSDTTYTVSGNTVTTLENGVLLTLTKQ